MKVYQCEQCDYNTSRKDRLTQHYQSVHMGINHRCEECGKQFTRKAGLTRHQILTHEGKQYPFQVKRGGNLACHLDSKHQNLKYASEQCDYNSIKKDSLNKHYQTFKTREYHSCQECGQQFTDEGNLTRHQKAIHEGILYQCNNVTVNHEGKMLSPSTIIQYIWAYIIHIRNISKSAQDANTRGEARKCQTGQEGSSSGGG
jgi:KRAB domain-containing zinc finger protein